MYIYEGLNGESTCRLSVKIFDLYPLSVNPSYFFVASRYVFLVLSKVSNIFSLFLASRLTPFTPSYTVCVS